MSFNTKLAKKNQAEKLKIRGNEWGWVLPTVGSFRKMVAHAQGNEWIWIHPDYQSNGQNDKKKK